MSKTRILTLIAVMIVLLWVIHRALRTRKTIWLQVVGAVLVVYTAVLLERLDKVPVSGVVKRRR